MRIGINPLIDCVFKKLFGSEQNKSLLLDILNAVLSESDEPRTTELEILNPYNSKDSMQDKLSIVDIRAKNENGEWFIIEVQIEIAGYFPKRLLYYWSRMYQSQLKEGENYDKIKKASLICFTQQALPVDTRNYHSHFKLLEVRQGITLCEDMCIHTIELEKFLTNSDALVTPLDRWVYFLKHAEDMDDENLPAAIVTPEIKQAVKEIKMFTSDEIERGLYEARRKSMLDQLSLIAYKLEKGRQQGHREGLADAARKMLQGGMTESEVARILGLSSQQLHDLL